MTNDIPPVDTNPDLAELQTSLAKARAENDAQQICLLLKKIGQIQLDKKDAPQALTCFEEALMMARKTQEKEIEAHLFGLKGLALKQLGNLSLSLEAFQKSYGIGNALHRGALMVDALIQASMIHSDLDNQKEAISSLNRAMEITRQNGDTRRMMRIASLLADNYFALEDFGEAEANYAKAYEIARDLGNHAAGCAFLTRRGNISLRRGEAKTAIGQYERALVIASDLEDRNAEINILGGLFRANALAGDAGLATFYGDRVTQMAHDIGHFEAEIINLQTLATFLVRQGDCTQAIAYLERARQLAQENQSPEWLLTIINMMAHTYYETGEKRQALEMFTQVLGLAEKYRERETEAKTLGYMGAILTDERNFDEAEHNILRAVEIARELDDKKLIGDQQLLLALNYREKSDISNAIQQCQAAIEVYQAASEPDLLAQATALLAELKN